MARKSKKPGRAVARALGRAAMRLAIWIGWRRAGLAGLIVFGPIVSLNLLVAFCGSTVVFPLSPRHLGDKLAALGRYANHRPRCLADSHPSLGPVVARVEARYRIPAGLLAALIQVESGGRPHRISPTGAMGQGQLAPSTARALSVDDPFDTLENVEASGRYLAQQLGRFGDLRLALAAYNAGPGAVASVRSVPHNGETELYVERVLRIHRATVVAAARERARIVAMAPRSSSRPSTPAAPLAPPAGRAPDLEPGEAAAAPSAPGEGEPRAGASGPAPVASDSDGISARRGPIGPHRTNPSKDARAIGARGDRKGSKRRSARRHVPPRDDVEPARPSPPDHLALPRIAERTRT